MKAFVLKEPGVVGYEQVPEPVLTPYGAILKPVAVAPCSSDAILFLEVVQEGTKSSAWS